jgi:serine/threonine protein kinase
MPYWAAQNIARQVAAAVLHIHGAGIVQGDLKPANVLVALEAGPDGNADLVAKLCDFGCASLLSG